MVPANCENFGNIFMICWRCDLGKIVRFKVTEEPRINPNEGIAIYGCADDPNIPELEDIVYSDDDEDVGAEVFAHVARIEAIRLFLAYVSFKDFVVYQMDVKSAFLYGKIEVEVYVCQLPGFEDPDFPDRRIIHKGWLKWNVTTARDEIEVKTGNSRVNAVGHYLVLLGKRKGRQLKGHALTASSFRRHSRKFEIASEQSNDPPLSRVATLKSGEDILKLKELMDFCTKLSDRVLDLEITKTAQAKEIASLKKIVNKLERKRKSKTSGNELYSDWYLGKQSSIFEENDFDDEGFDADIDEVFKYVEGDTEQVISAAADEVPTGTEVNTASAPVTNVRYFVKSVRLLPRLIVPPQQLDPKDKAQMQAKLKEEERLAREREEDANIAEWDNAQAIMDAYYKLAARIQDLRSRES
ncbi:copia protein [Tanacetum coccineum]